MLYAENRPSRVFGYKGKQVRDNLHSANLVSAFWEFVQAPRAGAVYNIGGGRYSNCSMLEAIELAQRATGRTLDCTHEDQARQGDHIWWISDCSAFSGDYCWRPSHDVSAIIEEIAMRSGWSGAS